jgi:hypothetical protein
MPDSERYCTIEDIKGRGVVATDDDILAAILRAQEWFDDYCRQKFSLVELSIDMDGSGHDTLFLDDYPIVDITAITYEDGNYGSSTYTVDVDDDIIIAEDEGYIVHRTLTWPLGDKNVHVVGQFGMEETPALIKEACILFAMAGGGTGNSLSGSSSTSEDTSLRSETIAGYSYSKVSAKGVVPGGETGIAFVDSVLLKYRRVAMMRSCGKMDTTVNSESQRLSRIIGD